MRVLVIGGTGFNGSRVVEALGRIGDATVVVGSRMAGGEGRVRVDLDDPSTFAAMRTFDVVIDCADSTVSSPIAAATWCLEHGPTFLETSAEPRTVLAMREALAAPARAGRGAVVLGVGLFPGLSNLLARALHDWVGPCERLELAVRLSPLSGAGRGMCGTMARMLVTDAMGASDGALHASAPVSEGIRVDFRDGGAPTLRCSLAEGAMLHWSMRVPRTAAYVATVPSLPRPILRLVAAGMGGGATRRRLTERLVRIGMWAMRGVLLRSRATAVEIVAIANRGVGNRTSQRTLSLVVDDGVAATAFAVAAVVELLASGLPVRPGVHLLDELTSLTDVLREMRELSGDPTAIGEPVSPIRLAS
jgi:hypothetical protein